MRRLIAFSSAGDSLVGTLDEAPGTTGLLIVSGGNEVRMGAHRGMALLAADIAGQGLPVFRYDRRGIGDSEGTNGGFESSGPDIAAAVATIRQHAPHVTRIFAFGNCDAASALALFHREAGIDALILSNPWIIEEASDLPPPAAIRARYAERLADPATWLRLLRGGINIGKVFRGLRAISRKGPEVTEASLAARMAAALGATNVPVTVLLAHGDNTAIAFRAAWDGPLFASVRARASVHVCDSDSHSYASPADKAWLRSRLLEQLSG